MPRTVITLNNPIIKVADTQGRPDRRRRLRMPGDRGARNRLPQLQHGSRDRVRGRHQSPGLTAYALDMAWLQDWTAPGGGLSGWADDNDATAQWFSFQLSETDATVKADGQVYVTAGATAGCSGTGPPPPPTPCLGRVSSKPVITKPVAGVE